MRTIIKHTYFFFLTLPDRLYPFSSKIEGRWVRGRRSYNRAVAEALRAHGVHRLGYKLTLYRELFHFLGSITTIILATLLSERFFGSTTALYVLLGMVVLALTFQEFYLHPRFFGQHLRKGVADWLVWVGPIVAYFLWFK